MAITIQLNEGNQPVNCKATLSGVTGGGNGLAPSTTYYYKIVSLGYNNIYYDTGYQGWISEPSAEFSVTTDATHKTVYLETDLLKDKTNTYNAEQITVYRTTTSGDYAQTNSTGTRTPHLIYVESGNTHTYCSLTLTKHLNYKRNTITLSGSETLTIGETITTSAGGTGIVSSGSGTSYNIYNKSGTWSAGNTLSGSVSGSLTATLSAISSNNGWVIVDNRTTTSSGVKTIPLYIHGQPVLLYDGSDSSDMMTPQKAYNYCKSISRPEVIEAFSMFRDGDMRDSAGNDIKNVFKMNCNIQDKGGDNYWYQEGGSFVIWAGTKIALKGNSQRGEYDSTKKTTTNGAGELHNLIYAWYPCLYSGEHKFYGSLVCGPTESSYGKTDVRGSALIQWSGEPIIKDSVIKSVGRFNAIYDVEDSRIMISGEMGDPTNRDAKAKNMKVDTYSTSFYSQSETTFPNFKMALYSSYTTYLDSYYGGILNKTLDYVDAGWVNTLYFARLSGNDTKLPDLNARGWTTHDFLIEDEKGNPIEDVKIKVKTSGLFPLFETNWSAKTYKSRTTTDTTIETHSTYLDVGSYYLIGSEIIKVDSLVSGSTYNISRAQLGTTANKWGGNSTRDSNYLYKLLDYKSTDSNGKVNIRLLDRLFTEHNKIHTYTYASWSEFKQQPVYEIILEKSGYKTKTFKIDSTINYNMKIKLAPISSYNLHKTINTI